MMSFTGMRRGESRDCSFGFWRIDLIWRTNGQYYIACQRDRPARRSFDVTEATDSAALDLARNQMNDLDFADGLLPR